ncbi:N-acetylmuramoyl-L-alanine amidase [Streptomyces gamaensis]|uniref:N-acetylmuramoyl-L-alanine amidase n=1 Tax=Streptomyces gamaensis TaxID=1763542 RepID=A0ABW0YRB4_9ACTN
MAPPMSAGEFLAALRAEGATVVEVDGWRTHNRAGHGAWGPVNGVMIHHTASWGTERAVRRCWRGRDDLPGPLAHGVIAKDGRVHLVGCGRVNHAGGGDSSVLRAVIAEKRLPRPRWADADGNVHFYGFECVNLGDGHDPWPKEQLLAIERVSAAICRHHGWNARSVIGHREWRPGKVDPVGFTMDWMRDRVQERLRA